MEFVRCLLIPLAEYYLLLPNAAVAGVLEYVESELYDPLSQMPHQSDGQLGKINWHGETVDLFSWEVYAGERLPPPSLTQCVVVVRLPAPAPKPLTLALLSQRIPHLLTVTPKMLQSVPSEIVGAPRGGIPLRVNGEAARIPDLARLQHDWGSLNESLGCD